jgi:hypothetical protein
MPEKLYDLFPIVQIRTSLMSQLDLLIVGVDSLPLVFRKMTRPVESCFEGLSL